MNKIPKRGPCGPNLKKEKEKKQRDIKVTNCQSTRAYIVRITKLGRTALYYYSVIMVVIGFIPFIKWEETVVEKKHNLVLSIIRSFSNWSPISTGEFLNAIQNGNAVE